MTKTMENPLNFSVYYGEDKANPNSLFVKADTTSSPVILGIQNQTTNKVSWAKPLSKPTVSADNCHLQLTLPNKVLADPNTIAPQDKNWRSVVAEDDTNCHLYLLYRLGRTLTGTS